MGSKRINKLCKKCGFEGDDFLFVKNKNMCKKCLSIYDKKYQKTYKRIRSYDKKKAKEYYENNKEKYKEYYENNKEKYKEKEYYENNKEKIRVRRDEDRKKNPEKRKEYRRKNIIKINDKRFNINTASEEIKPIIKLCIIERDRLRTFKKLKDIKGDQDGKRKLKN